jgi:branched-chain amino acid transport system ATP-binding protein
MRAAAASLTVEGLFTAYDRADVLIDVSLVAKPGEITCILGANGSGKTTLIRSVLGLVHPRLGRITLDGVDVLGWPTHRVIAAGVACIPEGRRVFPKMTVEENLRVGAFRESRDTVVRERMDRVYTIFPRLKERAAQLAGTMSGGEQAMVSIGRGLMSEPRLLLIDEPSLGLSPRFVQENFDVIRRVNAEGPTVLLVEQNARQTLAIAHHGYVLSGGKVVASGTAEALSDSPEVRQAYFG